MSCRKQAGKKKKAAPLLLLPTVNIMQADEGADADLMAKEQAETPTIFNAAQTSIFNLMNTDSFPRCQRTEEYKTLVKNAGAQFLANFEPENEPIRQLALTRTGRAKDKGVL